ncbi:MAG: asparagine synthase (glutamine-hydrolyzing) [Candidatus Omnitrophota bacterium]|jgi:asparagine synthase (glutamine-hydrolysing)
MCGIAGILNLDKERAVDPGLLHRMADMIKYRGPDGDGFYVNNNIGLAHRRLAVIDTTDSGSQPIYNEDKSLVIAYVGEVYNHKELKEGLSGKHSFYTKTDTEVVLHLFEEYGPECVRMLNGMFVFAIWDDRNKSLFLARDRLGIKALYYYQDADKIVFASEIKQILLDRKITRALNRQTLTDFIAFQNVLDSKTFFEGVFKLPAGHYMIVAPGRGTMLKKYWEADFTKLHYGEVDEYLHKYGEILEAAVKRHLISDVEVGCYLSGGFDSSSVACLSAGHLGYPLNTFTGAFTEKKKYDERECSRVIAGAIGGISNEIVITAKDYADNFESVMYHLDEPTLGSGAFAQYEVARLVGSKVKVVLTGHGGDELFAGYPVFKAAQYRNAIKKNPFAILGLIRERQLDETLRMLYFLLTPIIMKEVGYGLFIMFNEKERKSIFTADFAHSIGNYNPMNGLFDIIRHSGLKEDDLILYLYLKTYLPTLFIQEDKMGMAHSIEARTPLCDNELLEFSVSMPLEYKLAKGRLKFMTKEFMRDKLPEIIYRQPKKGFPTPLVHWYRGELKDFAYDALTGDRAKRRNIFNISFLRNLLDRFCASRTDSLYDYVVANKVYSLIAVEYWFRIFMDREIAG